jgi:Tfp pilus assembly protein PilF
MKPVFRTLFIFYIVLSVLGLGSSLCQARGVDDLLFQGADYQYNNELKKARQAFEQVLQIEPENEYALNQLGLICAKTEDFDRAYELFAKVVNVSPENTFARIWLGVLDLHRNDLKSAFAQFHRTLEIDPNNANGYYFLGVIYSVEHNMQKSIEFLRKAQKVGSDDPETHYRLANAFAGLDMVYNARLEYEKALELNPEYTGAMNALGWLYYNQGNEEKAMEMWKKALTAGSGDPEAGHNLAKVFNDMAYASFKQGNTDRAREIWEKTLKYDSGNKAAKYYLRKIE